MSFTDPFCLNHFRRYEGMLGTALELGVLAPSRAEGYRAEARILLEIERLEQVYSRYLSDSELNRWQRGAVARPSPDLAWLLREAEVWRGRTGGGFNPAAEALHALYRRSPNPSEGERSSLHQALNAPLWAWQSDLARKLTTLPLNFNALAKGRIADLACAAALREPGVRGVWVNLGGDLRQQGHGGLEVALAHPFSRADNAPALARLQVREQGVATSGWTQRGQHLYDPRSIRPATNVAQATILAPDAASADVLATAFCVLETGESLELAARLGVGCLIVDRAGQVHINPTLERQLIQRPPEVYL